MSGHALPFHCPYCGDEDLRPHGTTHGEWECRSCMRAFKLSFKGLLAPADVLGVTDMEKTELSPPATLVAADEQQTEVADDWHRGVGSPREVTRPSSHAEAGLA